MSVRRIKNRKTDIINVNTKLRGQKMVKGINKQMIVLRIEGNRIYESACFILKNEVVRSKESEKDMLSEANRLLEGMELRRFSRKKRVWHTRLLLSLLLLLVGGAIGFLVSFFLFR